MSHSVKSKTKMEQPSFNLYPTQLFFLLPTDLSSSPFFLFRPPPFPHPNLVFDSCLTIGRKPAHLRPSTVKYSDSFNSATHAICSNVKMESGILENWSAYVKFVKNEWYFLCPKWNDILFYAHRGNTRYTLTDTPTQIIQGKSDVI